MLTRLVERALPKLEREYLARGDSRHAWRAYRLARQYGVPVPEWVFLFMDAWVEEQLPDDNEFES